MEFNSIRHRNILLWFVLQVSNVFSIEETYLSGSWFYPGSAFLAPSYCKGWFCIFLLHFIIFFFILVFIFSFYIIDFDPFMESEIGLVWMVCYISFHVSNSQQLWALIRSKALVESAFWNMRHSLHATYCKKQTIFRKNLSGSLTIHWFWERK